MQSTHIIRCNDRFELSYFILNVICWADACLALGHWQTVAA